MVLKHLDALSDKNFRIISQVANQLAGRKPKRGHLDYNVPRGNQDRRHSSAYKDLASADDKHQVIKWIREDKHHRIAGGSISDAFRGCVKELHRSRARAPRGGGVRTDAFLRRTAATLHNLASTTNSVVDITADHFMSKIGLRERRYKSAEVSTQARLHARLATEMYKPHNERASVDGYSYVSSRSDDDYGLYEKDGKRIFVGRGTDPSSYARLPADLLHDAQIAMGHRMSDQNKLRERIRTIVDESDPHTVSLSGYSLAGGKMLNAALDDDIYQKLSDHSFVISPGVAETDPDLQKMATLDKFAYSYSAHDHISNALLQHANDNHEVNYDVAGIHEAHIGHIKNLANV